MWPNLIERKIPKQTNCVKQIHFLPRQKYFDTNLKASVKIEIEVEKLNDYDRVVELSNFCEKLIATIEKGLDLEEIAPVTNQRVFINGTTSYKLQRKNVCYTEY